MIYYLWLILVIAAAVATLIFSVMLFHLVRLSLRDARRRERRHY